MSETVTRPAGYVREVVGTVAQLQATIGTLQGRGYVVQVHNRREVAGRVRCHLVVTAAVREPARPAPARAGRPWWRRRWPYLTAAGTLAVAALGVAVIWLVQLVIAHLALVIGVLILLALVVGALGKTVTKHCPGCR